PLARDCVGGRARHRQNAWRIEKRRVACHQHRAQAVSIARGGIDRRINPPRSALLRCENHAGICRRHEPLCPRRRDSRRRGVVRARRSDTVCRIVAVTLSAATDRIWPSVLIAEMTTSPTAFAAVPSVEKVGEAIVPKTSDLACDRETKQLSEPCI